MSEEQAPYSAPGTPIPGEQAPAGDAGEGTAPDFESVAKEKGWKDKSEFDGPDWVNAEEFVKRQPLFDKIKIQHKKLKDLEKTVEALAKHYNTSVEQAKQRAIADLKLERKEAIELGQVSDVEKIDQKIEHVNKIQTPVNPAPVLATEIEEFIADQKDWFNKDDEMTQFAIMVNESYLKAHPGELKKSLEETLKTVKRAYPDKFVNSKRAEPPPVEGGGAPPANGSSKYSMNRLNPEQKIVYKQLITTHKQMTHDAYFKSLDDAGYLN